MDYYITTPGKEENFKGPFTLQQLAAMSNAGEIAPGTLYAAEGMTEWRRLEDLLATQAATDDGTKPPPIPPSEEQDQKRPSAKPPLAFLLKEEFSRPFRRLSKATVAGRTWLAAKLEALANSLNAKRGATIEERIVRLELLNRCLAGGLLLLVLLMIITSVAKKSGFSGLSGQQVALRDSNGKIRWQVSIDEKGSVKQSFFDSKGAERVYVGVDDESTARIRLLDGNGHRRVAAFAPATGDAVLSILPPGNSGTTQVGGLSLMCFQDHSATLQICDPKGNERYSVNTFANGATNQRLSDREGRLRLLSYTDDQNLSVQAFYDTGGMLRNYVGTTADGNCQSAILDAAGKIRLNAESRRSGTVFQSFVGADGRVKSSVSIDSKGEASQLIARSDAEKIWETTGDALQVIDILERLFNRSQR